MPPHRPLEERFREKFVIGEPDECWEWLGGKSRKGGYGRIHIDRSDPRKRLAHHLAYELHYGVKIASGNGYVVMHRCDNPGCVNPAHLRLGTMLENMRDRDSKGRRNAIGEKNGSTKLTPELVVRYRLELARGKPLMQLARETGLNSKTLSNMRDRITWKHVA